MVFITALDVIYGRICLLILHVFRLLILLPYFMVM